MVMRLFSVWLLVFFAIGVRAQNCTNLGQNPSTAFPVCGSSVFTQTNVDICGDRTIPTPCINTGALFQDKNPYWYKFTCFTAGTLGFVITPKNLTDDYDWQLFDITGKEADDVYTDASMFVACNWSGEGGRTGASSAGNSLKVCDGLGMPLFAAMPTLIKDHNYLLLVSHFTNSQSGYTLDFSGGTGSITDTTVPRLLRAEASCDGSRVAIKLNKEMKCNSLAINGSDFTVSGGATITGATGINCNAGFDTDSLVLTLSSPLQPGNYTVSIKKGGDGNTLLDNCNTAITAGAQLSFTVFPSSPTPFDSIVPVKCAPAELEVVFSKPVLCSSVAADGSDFGLTGNSGITITAATANCNARLTTRVTLTLSAPISTAGNFTVTLKPGSDGNTIINECQLQTPPGASVNFVTTDTVSADFNYNILYGCKADTVAFFHPGGNQINSWSWSFDKVGVSSLQNPAYIYPTFGPQQVKLVVSNGVCSDSAINNFVLDNELKANFTGPDLLCPTDKAVFRDTSIGQVVSWNWDFANGSSSVNKVPAEQLYPAVTSEKTYPVRLIVQNNRNCFDTLVKPVKVLYNCYIAVATAFTPNGDGRNDYLYPINAWKAKNLVFKVYNRFGQLIFETKDFTNKWDGTIKGIKQQTGTYAWTLDYIHTDSGSPFHLKGTTVLLR